MASDQDRDRELSARVAELEETVEAMAAARGVSRRDVLLGAGAFGAGVALPSAVRSGIGTAEAASVGQIGTTDQRVDLYGETVDATAVAAGSASITNQIDAGTVSTGELNTNYHFVDLDLGAAEIQSVVDDVGQSGGGIVVMCGEGTFAFDQEVTISHDNVELWGPGPAATITQNQSFSEIYILGIQGESGNRVENCAIRNVHVDGGYVENIDVDYANHCEVTGFISKNAGDSNEDFAGSGDGVDTDFCDHIYIGHGITRDNRQAGVHVSQGTKNSVVEHVWSFGDGHNPEQSGAGIDFRGDDSAGDRTTDNVVKNCYVFDAGDFGLFDGGQGNNTFRKCVVSGTTASDGVSMRGPDGVADDISIYDAGREGLFITADAEDAVARDIYIENPGRHGASLNTIGATLDTATISKDTSDDFGVRVIEADVSLWEVDVEGFSTAFTTDTRTRYNGIIGGGPLGGVDLSSTTGADAGDLARSDGSSVADADVLAVFDGSGWRYPDSTGTVNPS